MSDMARLPYVQVFNLIKVTELKLALLFQAVIAEVQRLAAVVPLSLPHKNMTEMKLDDGSIIPAGSALFLNQAFIMNDPKIFPNPKEFSPERFLDENGMQVFGGCFYLFNDYFLLGFARIQGWWPSESASVTAWENYWHGMNYFYLR